jgi:hypothetical protein
MRFRAGRSTAPAMSEMTAPDDQSAALSGWVVP